MVNVASLHFQKAGQSSYERQNFIKLEITDLSGGKKKDLKKTISV